MRANEFEANEFEGSGANSFMGNQGKAEAVNNLLHWKVELSQNSPLYPSGLPEVFLH